MFSFDLCYLMEFGAFGIANFETKLNFINFINYAIINYSAEVDTLYGMCKKSVTGQ